MATASLSAMSNEELLTELERLNFRVKVRDEKMINRLRNPMVHAHPCQFWPLCADAYKLSMANYIHYFRWYDFVMGPIAGFALGNLAFHARVRFFNPSTYRFAIQKHWYTRIIMPLLFAIWGFNTRCTLVDCRMYGLDENSREIELFGAMYPDEVEAAASRKKRYEQEYIRIKEQLHDMEPYVAAVDVPNNFFYDTKGPTQSGYFEQEKLKNERRREIELEARAKYA